ncbi:prepilin-type N-terminal cleavage/methylation domain-containing protein [Planococcus sp. SIMBA_160]
MKKFLQKKLKDQKGMTLIELLAVIVIIAIIAAIAIPAIGNIIENSRAGAIKSDALSALAAANLYYADNPEITTAVTIDTLTDGYLEDAGTFVDGDGDPVGSITTEGLITAVGTASGVSIDFNGADKTAINGSPNNTGNGEALVAADHSGIGTVTFTR